MLVESLVSGKVTAPTRQALPLTYPSSGLLRTGGCCLTVSPINTRRHAGCSWLQWSGEGVASVRFQTVLIPLWIYLVFLQHYWGLRILKGFLGLTPPLRGYRRHHVGARLPALCLYGLQVWKGFWGGFSLPVAARELRLQGLRKSVAEWVASWLTPPWLLSFLPCSTCFCLCVWYCLAWEDFHQTRFSRYTARPNGPQALPLLG